jgi:hypothetical protein
MHKEIIFEDSIYQFGKVRYMQSAHHPFSRYHLMTEGPFPCKWCNYHFNERLYIFPSILSLRYIYVNFEHIQHVFLLRLRVIFGFYNVILHQKAVNIVRKNSMQGYRKKPNISVRQLPSYLCEQLNKCSHYLLIPLYITKINCL